MGQPDQALAAFETALERDRKGRHLTLTQIGEIHLAAGRTGKARRAFEAALRFRRKHYQSEHEPALEGLLRAEEMAGRQAAANEARLRLREVRARRRGGAAAGPDEIDALPEAEDVA